ncbi:MAG: hypothetical protein DKT66_24585 [Candidatus Melainabacteria bacterium]|nr:MAG: hypothetical protein DKT66_24585 [Candidatus Melainabacteria bacterium]
MTGRNFMQLADIQTSIVDFLTGKSEQPPDSVSQKGLDLYRSLVFSEYQSLLEAIYPGTQSALAQRWDDTCQGFVRELPNTDFNVNRSARGFSRFLEQRCHPTWIIELSEYEYLLHSVGEEDVSFVSLALDERGDEVFLEVLSERPCLNPTLSAVNYHNDIPAILTAALNDEEIDLLLNERRTRLVIFRDSQGVRTLELNDVSWQLLSTLQNTDSFIDVISRVAATFDQSVEIAAIPVIKEFRRYFAEELLVRSIQTGFSD